MPKNSLPSLEPRNIADAATIETTAWRVFVLSIRAQRRKEMESLEEEMWPPDRKLYDSLYSPIYMG
jgi:hypothetical protein